MIKNIYLQYLQKCIENMKNQCHRIRCETIATFVVELNPIQNCSLEERNVSSRMIWEVMEVLGDPLIKWDRFRRVYLIRICAYSGFTFSAVA